MNTGPFKKASRCLPECDPSKEGHKKTRLVRSGFHVLPQTEAGTAKTIDD